MQHEGRAGFRCQRFERPLKLLQALLGVHFKHGVSVGSRARRIKHACELDGGWNGGLLQGVLLYDVLRDGKQICLWRADRLGVRYTEHAQIDLLNDIGHIREIAHTRQEEASKLIAMARDQIGNEYLIVRGAQ